MRDIAASALRLASSGNANLMLCRDRHCITAVRHQQRKKKDSKGRSRTRPAARHDVV